MLRSRKTKKNPILAVRLQYCFDGVQMTDEVITGPEASRVVAAILQNPNQKRFEVKQRWILTGLPKMTYRTKGKEIQFSFTHQSEIPRKRVSAFIILLVFLSVWSVIGLAAGYYLMSRGTNKNPDCIIFDRGESSYLLIDATEYRLERDGTLPAETRTFMNPWHQEVLSSCARRVP